MSTDSGLSLAARLLERRHPQGWRRSLVLWLGRVHGWIGLWGALLGLLFGVSGFVLNHREVLGLELMTYVPSYERVAVPAAAGVSEQTLAAWLPGALGVPPTAVRPPNARQANARPDRRPQQINAAGEQRWLVMLNTPTARIEVSYWRGDAYAEVKRETANTFATLARLHKGTGLGAGWVLFADTMAGAMVALTLTGVLLWTEMHTRRLLAVALIGGSGVVGTLLVLAAS